MAYDPYLEELAAATDGMFCRSHGAIALTAVAFVIGLSAGNALATESTDSAAAKDWTPTTLRHPLAALPAGDAVRGR